jgi:hypothetical protein
MILENGVFQAKEIKERLLSAALLSHLPGLSRPPNISIATIRSLSRGVFQ